MTEHAPLLPKAPQADLQQSSLRLFSVALSVFALIFLVSINTSIGTTVGPAIAADFDAFEHTSWISSCFMIASSCATPLAGRLSAVFTSRLVSFAASLFLAAGACVAALSPTFPVFLAGRVLMGLGGGSLLSSAIVVVLDLASIKRRGILLGIVNSAFTAGLSLGGALGAHASSKYGWRAAFWIQVPGILAASCASLLASKSIPVATVDTRSLRQKLAALDYFGSLTLTLGLCMLLYALAVPVFPWTIFLCSLCTLAVFTWIERHHAEPIIPLGLMGYPPLACAVMTSLSMMVARWVLLFYTPAWVMAIRGAGPTLAGLSLIPSSVGFALGSMVFGHVFVRHNGSFYWSAVASCIAFASSFLALLSFTPTTSLTWFAAVAAVNGVTTGAALTFAMGHVLYTLPISLQSIGAALMTASRGLGGSFGSAIASGIVARHLEDELSTRFQAHNPQPTFEDLQLIRRLKGAPSLVWDVSGWRHDEALAAYFVSLRGVFAFALGLGILACLLQSLTAFGMDPKYERKGEALADGPAARPAAPESSSPE